MDDNFLPPLASPEPAPESLPPLLSEPPHPPPPAAPPPLAMPPVPPPPQAAATLDPQPVPPAAAPNPGVAKAGNALSRWAASSFDYVRKVVGYYWSHRALLKEYIAVHVLKLKPSENRQREIRLKIDDNIAGAEFDDRGWKVRLPDCCVVCGQRTSRDWEQEISRHENLAWALYAPLFGAAAGVLVAVMFGKWLLPVGIVAGFALGYQFRSQTPVELTFRRCEKDQGNKKLPRVRLFSDVLIIRVGQTSIRQRFLGLEMAVPTSDEGMDDDAGGTSRPAAEEAAPLTMALAEEVHGTVQIDERPRLNANVEEGADAFFPEGNSNSSRADQPATPEPLAPYSQGNVIPIPAASPPIAIEPAASTDPGAASSPEQAS